VRPVDPQRVAILIRKAMLFRIMLIQDILINPIAIERLSDDVLLARLMTTVATHRRSTVEILMLLGEVETRKLHLQQGFTSLFLYCTDVLRFSESEAYHRIQAARTIRRFPETLKLLQAGELTFTTINLLSPHLTLENYPSLLASACRKTKREVEAILATLAPAPDVGTMVRRLPVSSAVGRTRDGLAAANREREEETTADSASSATAAIPTDPTSETGQPNARTVPEEGQVARGNRLASFSTPEGPPRWQPAARAFLAPVSADRYLLRLTITAETHTKLRYAQNLARHSVPSGDLATILDRALTLFVRDLERVKFARTDRPRPRRRNGDARTTLGSDSSGRRIPAETRREVWHRDGGRCTFLGPAGRCQATSFLEFHHILPFAAGGPATAGNITLRCRAHNQYEADQYFGPNERQPTGS
jgi:5-methylcytosine-specific restriction endonuclease McrA